MAAYEMPHKPKPFSKELAKEIREKWKKGATYVDLAEEYNSSTATGRNIWLQLSKTYQE